MATMWPSVEICMRLELKLQRSRSSFDVLHPDADHAPPPSKTDSDTHFTVSHQCIETCSGHARAVVEGAGGAW
eukprot:167080-Prymnesium_polylepis.1